MVGTAPQTDFPGCNLRRIALNMDFPKYHVGNPKSYVEISMYYVGNLMYDVAHAESDTAAAIMFPEILKNQL